MCEESRGGTGAWIADVGGGRKAGGAGSDKSHVSFGSILRSWTFLGSDWCVSVDSPMMPASFEGSLGDSKSSMRILPSSFPETPEESLVAVFSALLGFGDVMPDSVFFVAVDFGLPLGATGPLFASRTFCSSLEGTFSLMLIFFIPEDSWSTSRFFRSPFSAKGSEAVG